MSQITTEQAMEALKDGLAQRLFETTKWFKDNHIQRLKWVKNEDYGITDDYMGSYETVNDPLYHWRQSIPSNEKYIKSSLFNRAISF